MFVWVLLFREWVVTASVGTYICGVLVNDEYLYSRVYGMSFTPAIVYPKFLRPVLYCPATCTHHALSPSLTTVVVTNQQYVCSPVRCHSSSNIQVNRLLRCVLLSMNLMRQCVAYTDGYKIHNGIHLHIQRKLNHSLYLRDLSVHSHLGSPVWSSLYMKDI